MNHSMDHPTDNPNDNSGHLQAAPPPLLADDEPAACTVFNREARSRLVITCDHASHRIPRALDNLGLDTATLRAHIGWDIGAAKVARRVATMLDAVLIEANYSRLVIDINRPLQHPDSIATVSEQIRVPGNENVDAAQAARRANACFRPYHKTLDELVNNVSARGQSPLLVAVHSFTPVFNGHSRPWHIGVLWNTREQLAVELIEALEKRGLCVGNNQPYDAREAVGYTTTVHGGDDGLDNVLIEVRQDLVETDAGAAHWADILIDALNTVTGVEANA